MNETDLVMTSLILAMNTVSSSHRLKIFGVFTQSSESEGSAFAFWPENEQTDSSSRRSSE
jgi:hypothetical protein